jgi:hypothetical protein
MVVILKTLEGQRFSNTSSDKLLFQLEEDVLQVFLVFAVTVKQLWQGTHHHKLNLKLNKAACLFE